MDLDIHVRASWMRISIEATVNIRYDLNGNTIYIYNSLHNTFIVDKKGHNSGYIESIQHTNSQESEWIR